MYSTRSKPRPLFIFYLLVAYVFLQFAWWTFLMVQQNNEIYQQRSALNVVKSQTTLSMAKAENDFKRELHKRWIMIMGEGSVFLGLMILGIMKIKKTFKAEAALAQQQKNFLLSVTHELKSPLTSTKLQMQTLLKRELSKDKQTEIITNAIVDTERLNHLVENILMAAKIDNISYPLYKESTPLDVFVKDIFLSMASTLDIQKNLVLNLQEGISMEIDRLSFPSIVLNLFENAIKYSKKDAKIAISLFKKDNKILLSVADNGIGIDEKERENIFQKFYRIGNEETRTAKGTGLGLYIVKYLVETHGGKIVVKDNSPQGSIFEMEFIPS